MRLPLLALLTVAACTPAADGGSARVDVSGAGATFPYPLYRAWFSDYATGHGTRFNYYAVGSAEGLRLLEAHEVDFAASDVVVKPAQGRESRCGRVVVPTASGPVAVVYNLPALRAPQPLHFDATMLAGIFSGRIRRWNAPEIVAGNPGVSLPATDIVVVHRGRGSGTGKAFSDFLSQDTAWSRLAQGDSLDPLWPTGITAEGNEGVAVEVQVRTGSIGYVELRYARNSGLAYGSVRAPAGTFVAPGSDGYPILARTWLVLDPSTLTRQKAAALTAFVHWIGQKGAAQARTLEYVPAPPDSVAHFDSVLRALDVSGCAPR